jgi:hypothetical protein
MDQEGKGLSLSVSMPPSQAHAFAAAALPLSFDTSMSPPQDTVDVKGHATAVNGLRANAGLASAQPCKHPAFALTRPCKHPPSPTPTIAAVSLQAGRHLPLLSSA